MGFSSDVKSKTTAVKKQQISTNKNSFSSQIKTKPSASQGANQSYAYDGSTLRPVDVPMAYDGSKLMPVNDNRYMISPVTEKKPDYDNAVDSIMPKKTYTFGVKEQSTPKYSETVTNLAKASLKDSGIDNPTDAQFQERAKMLDDKLNKSYNSGLGAFVTKAVTGNPLTSGLFKKISEKINPVAAQDYNKLAETGVKNYPKSALAGDITGNVAAYAVTEGALAKAGLAKIANPIVKRLALGTAAGGVVGGAQSLEEGNSAKDVAKDTAIGAGMGVGGELVGMGIGKGLSAITKKLKGKGSFSADIKTAKTEAPEPTVAVETPQGNINTLNKVESGVNGVQPLKNDVPKKVVGAEPVIPKGQKERGFSANTRTDSNNPDALRNSYSENPLTYEQLGNPTTLKKAEDIFNQGYESARTQLGNLASGMKPEAVPLAKMLARQATESGNVQGAREILSDVAEKLTQAGQFSQAARLLRESDPETLLMTVGKQLKKLNQEGSETYGKKWKDFDLTPEELDMVSKIERGNDKSYEAAFEQIQKRIANEMPASATEKINAWRHMSMLLNPKTHIRNVGGNAIMMGMRKTAQRMSGIGQKVLKAENRTQSVFINKEYKQAANDYFEANKNDLLSGANKYNEGIKLNMPDKRVFKNNALESARKFNYDLLQKGDNPFFKNAYVDRLASYAQAKGIKDFSMLKQEAFDIAKKEAEQATYKDASVIADFLNKVKHPGKNASAGQKIAAVGVEAALPFTKTPINIIKRGIQYSPAGVINGLAKIKSKEGAAAAIDEMAKGLTGTGILGLGYLLASNGILTGKAEKDADLAEYNKNTGNSPFSVMGKYTYDWAQPFAVPLTVGVEIYNAIKDSPKDAKKMDRLIKENDVSKIEEMAKKFAVGMLDSFNASGDTVFNMSIMKGIRQLLGSGTKGFMESLAQTPQNYAMQFIPSVVGQTAGLVDPTVRQTYYKGNPIESAKAMALSKIPIASKSLEPKQTPWGQNVKRNGDTLIRAFSQFLSPGIMNEPQNINPEVDAELRRLNKMGETIQFPTVATNSFIWKGQKFDLSPKEYSDFQRTLGQNTLTAYTDYIKSPEYQKLNDTEKAKELSGIISDAKELAKFQLIKSKGLSDNPEIMNVPNKLEFKKKSQELTFDQQKELADLVTKNQKEITDRQNENKTKYPNQRIYTDKEILSSAREQANDTMKIKIGIKPKWQPVE